MLVVQFIHPICYVNIQQLQVQVGPKVSSHNSAIIDYIQELLTNLNGASKRFEDNDVIASLSFEDLIAASFWNKKNSWDLREEILREKAEGLRDQVRG